METDGFEQLKNQIQDWLQEAEKMILQIPQTQLHAILFFLFDTVRKDPMLLDLPMSVVEDGENWSMGPRQLVCLARVLLQRSHKGSIARSRKLTCSVLFT